MLRWLLTLVLLLPNAATAQLQISDAWIKHLPASVKVRAGYLTLYNPHPRDVALQSVHSQTFHHIEIHQTVEQDGLMQMQQIPQLMIEAKSGVQLSPGGLHLMMMRPATELAPGDLVTITIEFTDGNQQSFDMIVKE